MFIEKARNYFSLILSRSESAEELATKMWALARHAHDKHGLESGRCDSPASILCSCGECKDEEDLDMQRTITVGMY